MTEARPIKQRPAVRNWILIAGTVVIILFLFVAELIPRLFNQRQTDALAKEDPLPRVAVMQLTPNTKPIELILPSTAQANHFTPIWSRVNGYLVRYLVDIGDRVKAGELLAEIDTPETDEQLAQAQADLLNSMVERDIAKITSDRWQKLWDKNKEAVSKQEVDQYHANLQSTEALVLMNEKNVSKYLYQQQFKYIYAPFDGIITERLVDIGSLVYGSVNGISQELFQIVETDIIRFFVDVPQTYFTQIKDGLDVEVAILQLPNKIFKGTVTRFAKALDPIARTMQTQIDVKNEEGILYAGLYGTVKFLLTPDEINFTIPTTAVIITSGRPHVAIVDENNIVHLRPIDIGRDYGNRMEIISGLKENEQIVTIPSDKIREGVKVEMHN